MSIEGSRPFPAGLRLESAARSIEEMEEQSAFWGLETKQLMPGSYEGRISAVHSGNIQFARSYRSLGTLIRGQVPRGTVVLSVPVNAPRPIFYRGGLLGDTSVIALRHGEEVDFRSAGWLDMITIAKRNFQMPEAKWPLCAMKKGVWLVS